MGLEGPFAAHTREAVEQYQWEKKDYEGFANEVANLLEKALSTRQITYASIQKRAKDIESFRKKVSKRSGGIPYQPKYPNPLEDIEDLAGIRIITYFLKMVEEIDKVIYELFDVKEKQNKGEVLEQAERFGYQSVHYIVSIAPEKLKILEMPRYTGLKAEIQVRTILQHAWAEIEHDIQYKSLETIPNTIHRRFSALAGLLEIADREFQAIQDDDKQIRVQARQSVEENKLEDVEITADAVKAYLDKLLGPDARVVEGSYDLTASMLHQMGFKDFRGIDECIVRYVHRDLSSIAWRAKQGQVMRFETLLLAALGKNFILRHPRKNESGFKEKYSQALSRLKQAGIEVGKCKPVD